MPVRARPMSSFWSRIVVSLVLLGVEPPLFGQTAVMRGDVFIAEAFAQMSRHAFSHAAGVNEHEGGLVRLDVRSQPRSRLQR